MKLKKNFIIQYLKKYSLLLNSLNFHDFLLSIKIIKKLKKNNKIIFIGNGGSASIASHSATDFSKCLNLTSMTFNDANLITCLANDYGHENWMREALKIHAKKDDLIVLISSSGKSKNIINCALEAKKMKLKIITFSGFKKNNKLRSFGNVNFWVNSKIYNHIEMVHHLWILLICDYISNSK